jgi:acetoin utilization deacetylase AcuC-like enzyme
MNVQIPIYKGADITFESCRALDKGGAAEYLLPSGKVAIVDIDYHHGNGTQEFFAEIKSVFTASIHGDPSESKNFCQTMTKQLRLFQTKTNESKGGINETSRYNRKVQREYYSTWSLQ